MAGLLQEAGSNHTRLWFWQYRYCLREGRTVYCLGWWWYPLLQMLIRETKWCNLRSNWEGKCSEEYQNQTHFLLHLALVLSYRTNSNIASAGSSFSKFCLNKVQHRLCLSSITWTKVLFWILMNCSDNWFILKDSFKNTSAFFLVISCNQP